MKKLLAGAMASALVFGAHASAAQTGSLKIGPWQNHVETTENAQAVGNPEAKTSLIEFVSYSCSVCARFALEGDPPLELAFISPGHTRVEYRSIIRNALDLTVTMLANCGDSSNFKRNHAMFLRSQKDWLPAAANAPQTQQAVWARADTAARINMANALGFLTKLENRGYSRSDLTRCLSDNAEAQRLLDNSAASATEFGITGTPSFALDGTLLAGVHSWDALYPLLSTRVREIQRAEAAKELPQS